MFAASIPDVLGRGQAVRQRFLVPRSLVRIQAPQPIEFTYRSKTWPASAGFVFARSVFQLVATRFAPDQGVTKRSRWLHATRMKHGHAQYGR